MSSPLLSQAITLPKESLKAQFQTLGYNYKVQELKHQEHCLKWCDKKKEDEDIDSDLPLQR